MSVYDASTIVIDDCRVICQIVTSLSDNSRDVIFNHKMFMKVAPGANVIKLLFTVVPQ